MVLQPPSLHSSTGIAILEIKAMSECGEIDDAAMREMFDQISRE